MPIHLMNPHDSNVESANAATNGATGGLAARRAELRDRDRFLAWLKEETIAITIEHFGSDGRRAVDRLGRLRKLANVA